MRVQPVDRARLGAAPRYGAVSRRFRVRYPRGTKARTYRVARYYEKVVPRHRRVATFCRPQTFEVELDDDRVERMTTTGEIKVETFDQRRTRHRRTDEEMQTEAYRRHVEWLGEKKPPKARRPRPPRRAPGTKQIRRMLRGRVDRKGERIEYIERQQGRRKKDKTRAKRYQ